MAAPYPKKQHQQQQQQQQHSQLSDSARRPNIWRFISAKRFGHKERRDPADEDEDNVQPGGPSNQFYDDSDGSNSGDEDGADAGSVCSRYTDALSHWSHPLTNREDAISFAFSELLQNETQDGSPGPASSPGVRYHAHGTTRRPDSSGTINASSDAVVNFQGLENQFDAYFARSTPFTPSRHSPEMAIDPFSALDPPRQQYSESRATKTASASPQKGKAVQRTVDWSSTANPWALLPASSREPEDREALIQENARLRAELDELKANTRGVAAPEPPREEVDSPGRSPAARPSSRLRKLKHKRQQDVTLFETTTLRDLVLKRLFTPHVIVDGIIHDDDQPVTLDTPLTAAQIHDFTRIMNDVIVSGSHLKQPIALCAVCHLPKFKSIKTMQQNSYVSEVLAQLPMVSAAAFEDFDPTLGTSACCRKYVCKTCLSAAIISGISTHWWFDLQSHESNWLKCPVPICGKQLPLYSEDEVSQVLERLGVHNISTYLERYRRAAHLRAQLQALEPAPGKDEMRRSKALHDRLVRHRRMRPVLEEPPAGDSDEDLRVQCLPVDTADGRGTLTTPIFERLFKHRTPRTCLVCDEHYSEMDAGNIDTWNRITKGFGGDWQWRVLAFPTAQVLPDCHHDHEICRACLGKYVTTQVETQGHSVVDNISCPTPDCQHTFTHIEIRKLATPEAFALYDRYSVLKSISSQPNFRWCLREGCVSGSLYDDPSTVPAEGSNEVDMNCIECSDCKFTMCFSCQTPWHPSLTCAQQASQRETSFAETQTWLAQHTKPCPGDGCGVQVQKGDGCFHMTCSRCHYEFCWECLADWRGIFVPGENGGLLRPDGHREGCFFRGDGAPLPTQVMGQDLAEGLRRLEQRNDGPVAP